MNPCSNPSYRSHCETFSHVISITDGIAQAWCRSVRHRGFRAFEIVDFEVVLFEQIVEVRAVFAGELGAITTFITTLMGYYRVLITLAFRDVIILSPFDPLPLDMSQDHTLTNTLT